MKVILIYIILMNLIGYAIMGIDKRKAKKGKWRIPERTLFEVAILGGSIGTLLGMKHFRHKTKHRSFVYGVPMIIVLQIIAAIVCAYVYIK